jgi:hypothetical protein
MSAASRRPLSRRPAAARRSPKARTVRPTLEALEDRLTPSPLVYHGGPLIKNVQVETLYYGSNWGTDPNLQSDANRLDAYLGFLTQSS